MKKLVLLVLVVLATWASVAWGNVTAEAASPFKSPEKPPNVTKFRVQGQAAFAEFSSSDNCGGYSYIYLFASKEASKEGSGNSNMTSMLNFLISSYDACSGKSIFGFSDSSLAPDALSVGGKLDSAKLNTVVQVCCDQNGSDASVTINLTWAATGPLETGKSSYHSKAPGCKISNKTEGDFRTAVATGHVTALDTEWAPQPSVTGNIQLVKSGTVEHGCN